MAYNRFAGHVLEAAQLQQAVAFLKQGQPEQSRALCEDLLKQNPRQPDALHILGVLAHHAGRLDEARRLITQAITVGPASAAFHSNLGNVLQDLNQPQSAVKSYDRALALQPDLPETHYNRALALEALGRPADAIAAYGRTIALSPQFAAPYYNRALALHASGKPADAVADYDRALALTAADAATHYNRANALQDLGRYDEAVAGYDRAIALDARLASAHFNRGNALMKRGRARDAQESYRRALRLDPNHRDALKNVLWLEITNPSPGADLEAFITQACEDMAALEARLLTAHKAIPAFRVKHDLEQSAYLLARGREDMRALHKTLAAIQARKPRDGELRLSDAEVETVNQARSHVSRIDVGADLTEWLNPENDWSALEAAYLSGKPEIMVIDNLLAQPALLAVRRFCLESTVWRTEYKRQYLGAFSADGFISPLFLRIAQDFREKMPRIFSDHPLEQLWGFKYDSKVGRGINLHADFARVNLNFWVTPDEANLNPASGGLVLYDEPAPKSWNFDEYNRDSKRIDDFLKEHNAGRQVVPYRCNRGVLFNSKLFHQTDAIQFKEGYENRRVNITYLFGRGLSH